jgi:hypothetical protein
MDSTITKIAILKRRTRISINLYYIKVKYDIFSGMFIDSYSIHCLPDIYLN